MKTPSATSCDSKFLAQLAVTADRQIIDVLGVILLGYIQRIIIGFTSRSRLLRIGSRGTLFSLVTFTAAVSLTFTRSLIVDHIPILAQTEISIITRLIMMLFPMVCVATYGAYFSCTTVFGDAFIYMS